MIVPKGAGSTGSGGARKPITPGKSSGGPRIVPAGAAPSTVKKPSGGVFGSAGNALMGGLKMLDKPRAAIVSTAAELGDALGGQGFSVNDIRQNINRNYSVGDVLKESTNLPGWARAGLGFVGDVVLDPLTYLGGAGLYKQGAQKVARQLVDPRIASQLTARGFGKEATDRGVSTLISKGVSGTDENLLKALGEITGKSSKMGVYFGASKTTKGIRIPGSEQLARSLDKAGNAAKSAFIGSRVGTPALKLFSGGDEALAEFKAAAKTGDTNAWHRVETHKAARRAEKAAEAKMSREVQGLLKPLKGNKALLDDLRRGLEGDEAAINRMLLSGHGEQITQMRAWFDQAADSVGIPKLNNYFPRQLSKEAREELKRSIMGGKPIGAAMKRELVEGKEFLGEVLTGTPAEIREQIERLVRQRFGKDASFFSDNPLEVLSAYTKQIARRRGQLEAKDQLIKRIGLAQAPAAAPTQRPKVQWSAPKAAARAAEEPVPAGVGAKAAGAADVPPAAAAEAPRPKMSARDQVRYDEAVKLREELVKRFDHAAAAADAGKVSELLHRAGLSRQAAAAATDMTQARVLLKQAEAFETEAQKLAAKGGRAQNLQERIRQLDEEMSKLSNPSAAKQQARADYEEAARLDDAAATEPDPKMAQKARLESEAAEHRATNPADKKTEYRMRGGLTDDTRFHQFTNMVKENVRLLADGTDVEDQADILSRIGRLETPGGQKGLIGRFDDLNNFLKRYQIFTPGFHIRNHFGGEFNNWLAGVSNQSKREWRQIWVKSKFGTDISKLSPQQKRIFLAVEETGALGTTQATDVAEEAFGRSWINPAAKNFAPIQASRRAGAIVEGKLRGELALDTLRKTRGDKQAAFDQVAKFHFDYDDLSTFERSVMKRIIPFYTWTRKNLPLQMEQIVKQPAKYTAYLKAKQNIETLSPEEGVVPSYYEDLLSIRMPFKVGEGQAYLAPDLPFRDMAEYLNPTQPGRAFEMIKSSVSVPLKLPLEMQAGKKFFNDQPFYEGWSQAPGNWSKMPGLMPALAALRLADKGADGKFYMDQRDQYKVEQLMPLLARVRRMLPAGEGDEYLAERQLSTNLSTLLGIGLRANTPAAQKSEMKRRDKIRKAALKKQKDLGYVP